MKKGALLAATAVAIAATYILETRRWRANSPRSGALGHGDRAAAAALASLTACASAKSRVCDALFGTSRDLGQRHGAGDNAGHRGTPASPESVFDSVLVGIPGQIAREGVAKGQKTKHSADGSAKGLRRYGGSQRRVPALKRPQTTERPGVKYPPTLAKLRLVTRTVLDRHTAKKIGRRRRGRPSPVEVGALFGSEDGDADGIEVEITQPVRGANSVEASSPSSSSSSSWTSLTHINPHLVKTADKGMRYHPSVVSAGPNVEFRKKLEERAKKFGP